MQIELKAKLILTVPLATEKDDPDIIALEVEQAINERLPVIMMPETGTKVGIRIHLTSPK